MRKLIITMSAVMMVMTALAQQLPQFTSSDYEHWTYNNPGVALSSTNIASGKIVLYVDRQGKVLTLASHLFSCSGMDSITAQVNWFTRYFTDPEFVLSRTALTLAIDNAQGVPLDSVTFTPTAANTSTHQANMSIAVPAGTDSIRMRLVSWRADVVSSGAVRSASFQAHMAATPQPATGDVNHDGTVNVADVTLLIQKVLDSGNDVSNDINRDGTINVADVTLLITMILMGE